jgi:hypothetical protein
MASKPYAGIIGSLLYACNSRPDIVYATNVLASYTNRPGKKHYQAALRVLAYLHHTRDLGLHYSARGQGGGAVSMMSGPEVHLDTKHAKRQEKILKKLGMMFGYSDSDWGGDQDTMRSFTGYVMFYGGAAISWASRRQPTVALSSTEAEYMAASAAVQDVLFLRLIMADLGVQIKEPTVIFEDNSGTIFMSKAQGNHKRMKHLDLKVHFVREACEAKLVELKYINTKDQAADMMTKPLGGPQLRKLRAKCMGYDGADSSELSD